MVGSSLGSFEERKTTHHAPIYFETDTLWDSFYQNCIGLQPSENDTSAAEMHLSPCKVTCRPYEISWFAYGEKKSTQWNNLKKTPETVG